MITVNVFFGIFRFFGVVCRYKIIGYFNTRNNGEGV